MLWKLALALENVLQEALLKSGSQTESRWTHGDFDALGHDSVVQITTVLLSGADLEVELEVRCWAGYKGSINFKNDT